MPFGFAARLVETRSQRTKVPYPVYVECVGYEYLKSACSIQTGLRVHGLKLSYLPQIQNETDKYKNNSANFAPKRKAKDALVEEP